MNITVRTTVLVTLPSGQGVELTREEAQALYRGLGEALGEAKPKKATLEDLEEAMRKRAPVPPYPYQPLPPYKPNPYTRGPKINPYTLIDPWARRGRERLRRLTHPFPPGKWEVRDPMPGEGIEFTSISLPEDSAVSLPTETLQGRHKPVRGKNGETVMVLVT